MDENLTDLDARTSWINAATDFGVIGDGSTNNSTALITMRNAMIADPGTLHRVYFPPGDYQATTTTAG